MIKKIKWYLLKILQWLFLQKNKNVKIGRHTYGVPIVYFGKSGTTQLTIGKYCSLPHKRVTFFLGGEHRHDWISTYPFQEEFDHTDQGQTFSKGPITVGHDVWFGMHSAVMSGVSIGNGAVIAAYSLVTKDVPPYAIVGGIPAKIIKYRFSQDQITKLLDLCWWDWSDSMIRQNLKILCTNDVEIFLQGSSNGKFSSE